jgi:hypothetical protein
MRNTYKRFFKYYTVKVITTSVRRICYYNQHDNYQSCRSVALISIKLNNERNLRIIIHDVSLYVKYL